jgi:hypothetical protein
MLHVQCKSCKDWAVTENMGDPDSALECDCCNEDHSHAGTGCRPVIITVLPGSIVMHPVTGG